MFQSQLHHSHKSLRRLYLARFLTRPLKTVPTVQAVPDQDESVFKFTDYDCIGFDLDHTLAKYKYVPLVTLTYDTLRRLMLERGNYSPDFLRADMDLSFITRGVILDDENGNVIKLGEDGTILRASHGSRILMKAEVQDIYLGQHWKKTDEFLRDPILTFHAHYWNSMYPLLDVFDTPASLVFARAVDQIDARSRVQRKHYNVWSDIRECFCDMYDVSNFKSDRHNFYSRIFEEPEAYYEKPDARIVQWLRELKKHGKLLYLITSSYQEFGEHTAKIALGEDWRDLFDVVVYNARKPGFFYYRRPFLAPKDGQIVRSVDQWGKFVCQGNFTDLHLYLQSRINSAKPPKFLYIGDHLLHDVYAPEMHTECDTVFVCPEFEVEGFLNYDKKEEMEEHQYSFIWGSFFTEGNKLTNWGRFMKKHAKLCVPSLVYVASFPLDAEFKRRHLSMGIEQWEMENESM